MSKSTAEDMHVYLTRDNACIDANGVPMTKRLAVHEYLTSRNRNENKTVPCSSFGKYRHSRHKGLGYFFVLTAMIMMICNHTKNKGMQRNEKMQIQGYLS